MISIINYGLGNIKAIASAYNFLGIEYHIANKPGDLDKSSHIILPGVGSFDDAMSKIKKTGFKEKLDLLVMNENINILANSTSEIKLSVIIDEDNTLKAIKKLHTVFDLD